MSRPILIATMMRPEGDTGVQSHFHAFLRWAGEMNMPVRLLTPFSSPRWQVYPVFGLRRLIDPLHRSASVWWYRFWHAMFLQRALHTALKERRPCTVYAQCPSSAAAALRARTSPAQLVVMVVHFNISQADEWVGKGMISKGGAMYCAIRKFEDDVLPAVDGLVFVSDFMRREVFARLPQTATVPFRIVPNFLRDPCHVGDFAPEKTDLICIGSLEPRKNQRHALEIVAAAARRGRPLCLTVVGDGPDRVMLEALASQLNITQNVSFVGYVSNAANLMSKHCAYLHVARMESFGIVLIEAMAHGLPVFAPPVGGIPEVFNDGQQGRLISLEDADAAAGTIIEWLDCEETMTIARKAARARFLAHFEATQVAKRLADFLMMPEVEAA